MVVELREVLTHLEVRTQRADACAYACIETCVHACVHPRGSPQVPGIDECLSSYEQTADPTDEAAVIKLAHW